ncbi:aminopeptidase P family protein [Phocaeicola faecalis]|uniref:aminopeptidase P family protein n=1 Tax=Phocaeicola faecalis TaxID=2786956 RepID=UPI001F265F04|nr:aminopeptidase P family protein [Phocaeicola faecalis]
MKFEIKQRVAALRKIMQRNGIQAFILPTTDPHNSEYVAAHWEARKWLTGFTGSAGTAVITMKKAGLWTDSRYFLQAAEQLEGTGITLFKDRMPGTPSIAEWLSKELKKGDIIGMDGWVNGIDFKESLYAVCSPKGIQVESVADPFDEIWKDRPSLPSDPIFILEEKYAGRSCRQKIELIREEIRKNNCQSILLSALDEIAWTLNLRGSDVHCNPVFISYMHITQKKATLYIIEEKLSPEVKVYLEENGVILKSYHQVEGDIKKVRQNIQVSPALNMKLFNAAGYLTANGIDTGHKIMEIPSPVSLLKAVKNETEINGFRHAMERDGIAMVKFLKWLKTAVPAGNETELSVDRKLYELRAEQADFKGISFDTIAGYKEHAAIVHYEATPETDIPLKPEGMLLLDSGAQYLDGTTDITRTIVLGPLSNEEKTDYTLVLKGFLQLQNAIFPEGTCGTQLDILARQAMWKAGVNYFHGTGHGVGHFLCVHEGPHQIRMNYMPTPLRPGMTVTDEPGIYKAGRHGIRTENTLLTVPAMETEFGSFMKFEPLTLCPIDKEAIVTDMLTDEEITWFNEYHEMVYNRLSSQLNKEEQEWLKEATSPLKR